MLLKVVFVKILKISNNFKQNIDETHSKQTKFHTSLWILKILWKKSANQNQKFRDFPNVCDFQKENHILGYGF
jgi:hypothetical protein